MCAAESSWGGCVLKGSIGYELVEALCDTLREFAQIMKEYRWMRTRRMRRRYSAMWTMNFLSWIRSGCVPV